VLANLQLIAAPRANQGATKMIAVAVNIAKATPAKSVKTGGNPPVPQQGLRHALGRRALSKLPSTGAGSQRVSPIDHACAFPASETFDTAFGSKPVFNSG
jgi:hypothetical protein